MLDQPIKRDKFKNPLSHHDYALMASLGLIPGISTLNKYGRNKNVDATPTDIYDVVGVPTWPQPTEARPHGFKSSNVGDDAATGEGCQMMRAWGLLSWDTKEVSHDITMAGSDTVMTTSDFVIIHRAKSITYGDSGPNLGNISITAGTDDTITAQVNSGAGQTQMAIYGVPSVQKFRMTQAYGNLNKAAGASVAAEMTILANESPDTGNKFIVKHTFNAVKDGDSDVPINFDMPKKFDGPCIIKVQGDGSAADLDVSGGFNGYLVDN